MDSYNILSGGMQQNTVPVVSHAVVAHHNGVLVAYQEQISTLHPANTQLGQAVQTAGQQSGTAGTVTHRCRLLLHISANLSEMCLNILAGGRDISEWVITHHSPNNASNSSSGPVSCANPRAVHDLHCEPNHLWESSFPWLQVHNPQISWQEKKITHWSSHWFTQCLLGSLSLLCHKEKAPSPH